MLQVRKVRVGDVGLRPVHYSEPGERGEGVLLKAESHRPDIASPEVGRRQITWASVHMNMGVANAQPPGKELLLALADEPSSNTFKGAVNSMAMEGRINIPEESFYSFVVSRASVRDIGDSGDVEFTFHGNEASDFVRALLRWWFWYEEK